MISAVELSNKAGLSFRTARRLVDEFKPDTLDELAERLVTCSDAELLRLPGFGRKSLGEVKERFRTESGDYQIEAEKFRKAVGGTFTRPFWEAYMGGIKTAEDYRLWVFSGGNFLEASAKVAEFGPSMRKRILRWVFPDYDAQLLSDEIASAVALVQLRNQQFKEAEAKLRHAQDELLKLRAKQTPAA